MSSLKSQQGVGVACCSSVEDSSFFSFYSHYTSNSTQSSSTTSSTVKKGHLLTGKKYIAVHSDVSLNIVAHVCLIFLCLWKWGTICCFHLSLHPVYPPRFVSPCLLSVAASASDLNAQQGVVGRDFRCERALWLRESWRSNTLMIRTTGWHWGGWNIKRDESHG